MLPGIAMSPRTYTTHLPASPPTSPVGSVAARASTTAALHLPLPLGGQPRYLERAGWINGGRLGEHVSTFRRMEHLCHPTTNGQMAAGAGYNGWRGGQAVRGQNDGNKR